MSKPSIEEQIEAVECVHKGYHFNDEVQDALAAAITTLQWAKKYAPVIKTCLCEFPGSRVAVREEE